MLRAFIGCTLDREAHERVRTLLSTVRGRFLAAGGRATFTPDANLHVTLKFLGMIDDAQVEPIKAALAAVATRHRAIEIHLAGLGAFPHKGPPRVIFAAIDAGHEALVSLARDADAACAALGHAAEQRPFHAHVTLARTKPGPRIDLARITPTPCDAGIGLIETVTLFRSTPGPTGSVYTPLFVAPLALRT